MGEAEGPVLKENRIKNATTTTLKGVLTANCQKIILALRKYIEFLSSRIDIKPVPVLRHIVLPTPELFFISLTSTASTSICTI